MPADITLINIEKALLLPKTNHRCDFDSTSLALKRKVAAEQNLDTNCVSFKRYLAKQINVI